MDPRARRVGAGRNPRSTLFVPGVKSPPSLPGCSGKLLRVDTRNTERSSGGRAGEHYEERGLGAWIRRNRWLLTRLFIVMVFTFGASTTAANFSYGLEEIGRASCRERV